jgi:tRNA(adenine34) deaminase
MFYELTIERDMVDAHDITKRVKGKYLTDCTLYVTVEPCLMCAGALGWSQIKRIVFGASDDKRGYHTFCENPFHKKTEVKSGVLADECASLMTSFFKNKR